MNKYIQKLEAIYPKATHLLKPEWRIKNEQSNQKSTGFCYIAAEALFHMMGGLDSGFRPMCASYEGGTHWWLEKDGIILDPTASQFLPALPPYGLGRRCGFLTGYKKPSKRAVELIGMVKAK